MFHIETLINGRWVRISSKPLADERARNNVAYLIEDSGSDGSDYRVVPA